MVAVVDQPELEQFPKYWGSLWITQSRFGVPLPSARFHSSRADDAGGGAGRGGRRAAYRLHGVVHRQEGLQALPLQHVGELHVDGPHGPRVTQDPVLVGVGRVVVAWGAGGQTRIEVRPGRGWGCPPTSPPQYVLGLQPRLKPRPSGRMSGALP